jgi:hypothetical protein
VFKKHDNKSTDYEPTERGFYAFNIERAGDFLIFVKSLEDCHEFLYVPGATQFYMSFKDFTLSIKKGVLSFVEQLPQEIFEESLELSCPSA